MAEPVVDLSEEALERVFRDFLMDRKPGDPPIFLRPTEWWFRRCAPAAVW